MSITGREDEFRQLFAEEAEQRLNVLGAQLLRLEEHPDDEALIASLFREAHTLKGAAAVVGLDEISIVAHAMESLLHELRSGVRAATPDLIDGILAAVDGVRLMLVRLLAGEDQQAEASALRSKLVTLLDAAPAPEPAPEPEPDTEPETARPAEAPDQRPTPPRDEPSGLPAASLEPAMASVATVDRDPEPSSGAVRADAETVRVPLTRLDQIVRLVGESAAAHLRVGRRLGDQLGVDPGTIDEVRELSRVLNELQELTMRARMVPVVSITDVLQRAVRDVARSTGKNVRWDMRGEDTELDRGVLQQLADPLLHIVRNAVDHGIEQADERVAAGKPLHGTVRFHAMQIGSEVIITITDDGRGIDVDRVRAEAAVRNPDAASLSDEEALYLVFRSGLSTASFVTDISGRGVGLDVVRTNVDAVRGRVEIRTDPGKGTEFRVIVPITLAVLRCLLVRAGGRRHAIPMHSIAIAQGQGLEERSAGNPVVWHGSQALPLSSLGEALGLPADEHGPIVIVSGLTRRHAFRVEELLGQRDVVVKGLSRLLPRLGAFAGASVEPDGSILLVLDVPGLIDQARRHRGSMASAVVHAKPTVPTEVVRATILVVDDAMTVRELQRSILERAGYQVITASDGVEAMARLSEAPVDLVLTDVEMPRLDGFGLTEAIRAHASRGNVPVLILTSRASEEDRQRGLLAGADGYIIKSAFDEAGLLSAVERLLGH